MPTFDTYLDFTRYLADRKCPNCNTGLIQSSKDVDTLFQSWLKGGGEPTVFQADMLKKSDGKQATINSQVKCKKCSKATCIACFGRSGVATKEKDVEGKKLSWCCSRGRLFIIWILLCGFDQEYCSRKRREASTTGTNNQTRSGSGVGYMQNYGSKRPEVDDGKKASGVGYMQNYGFPGSKRPEVDDGKKAKALSAEQRSDRFDQIVFSILALLCPSPHHEVDSSSFDVRPPKAVVSMLTHSKILNMAAELLRNDSLDNATQRSTLYMALISFLKRVGVHEASKQEVIFDERMVLPANDNLLSLSFSGVLPKPRDTASSLADGLRRLNIQSDMMMEGAQKVRSEFQDQRGQDMLWLCREISDLSSHLGIEDWWNQRFGGEAAQMKSVVEIPDEQFWPAYRFAAEAQGLRQSPPGRIKRLITEITSLKTGLSTGIFVKHAMSRLDVMRILIIGPDGTPYANGLFEFDLWCPAEYPKVPPLMKFKYAPDCRHPLNPNLHLDGKVCLSLLGTWVSGARGEEWMAGQSTLLQVLISVQAMIFCEDPVMNEPFFGVPIGQTPGLSAYNKNLRGLTTKYGLLHWAKQPSSLWRDIVEDHFKKMGDDILRTVERWASEHAQPAQPAQAYSPSALLLARDSSYGGRLVDIVPLLPQLETALKQYGATYVPRPIIPANLEHSRQDVSEYGRQGGPYGGSQFGPTRGAFGGNNGFGAPGGRGGFGGGPGSLYGRRY